MQDFDEGAMGAKDQAVVKSTGSLLMCIVCILLIAACSPLQTANTPLPQPSSSAIATTRPDWFDIKLIDAQTGETFTMNTYAGKVVLLETMAMWCPNCIVQANEVRKLHIMLGNPEDLISVSLDVDVNETIDSLRDYAKQYGFEWHFAIAPIEVARALGNLYTAQYLNPPLAPMLIIDREGKVHHLEFGIKDADTLKKAVEPYLAR